MSFSGKQSLVERDQQVIWHPFTHTALEGPPIPLTRGTGSYLIGEDGRQYLDAISSWWVNMHGHSERTIAQAIATQAHTLEHAIFAGFTHEPAVALAEKVLSILPDNQARLFYSDNGSTAVEVALKMAIQHVENSGERRDTLMCLEESYHGDTFGAMSVSARDSFTAPFADYLFEVSFLASPTLENNKKTLEQLTKIIEEKKPLAFIFEPLVQAAGGMIMHDPALLSELIKVCRENGVITIADEVMTGFGRTGALFASEQLSSLPDIMCLSKGITGGFLPLGATTCSQEIFDSFQHNDRRKFFFHGHSYTGNPLACAAGVASFDLLMSDETQKRLATMTELHIQALERFSEHPALLKGRVCGTVLAVELSSPEESGYHNSLRDRLYTFFIDRGFLIRPLGNIVYLMPPYCITDDELESCYQVILEAADASLSSEGL